MADLQLSITFRHIRCCDSNMGEALAEPYMPCCAMCHDFNSLTLNIAKCTQNFHGFFKIIVFNKQVIGIKC